MSLSIETILYLAALLFALGVYGLLTRRDPFGTIAALQVASHGALVALIALERGTRPASGSNVGFADAFGVLVVVLLCFQAILGVSLALALRTGSGASESKAPAPHEREER